MKWLSRIAETEQVLGRDFSIVVPDARLVSHVTSSNSIVCPVPLPRLSSLYICFLTKVIGVLFTQQCGGDTGCPT